MAARGIGPLKPLPDHIGLRDERLVPESNELIGGSSRIARGLLQAAHGQIVLGRGESLTQETSSLQTRSRRDDPPQDRIAGCGRCPGSDELVVAQQQGSILTPSAGGIRTGMRGQSVEIAE